MMFKKSLAALIMHFFQHLTTSRRNLILISKFDNSDSKLSNFDPDIFGCGQITPEVENTWEICNPLDEVYGKTTSKLIKAIVNTATEEIQCAGLKFFKDIIPDKDRSLIATCTEIYV